MGIDTAIAIGAIALSLLTLMMRVFDKSLSRGEHTEFKEGVLRDLARLEKRLDVVEQTRPTTGELEARIKRQ